MKKVYSLGIMLGLLFGIANGASLKPVKTIGDENDGNYLFFRISGAILSDKHDIYVLDSKGHFIAKYDWNGKFIKKVGGQGEGPGSFSLPIGLDMFNGRLYFIDVMNTRIAQIDPALDNLKYYKMYSTLTGTKCFFVLENNLFITEAMDIESSEYNGLQIVDMNSGSRVTFFDKTPIEIPGDSKNQSMASARARLFFRPHFGIDRKRNRVLVTFSTADNPVKFYVYTLDGTYVDEFSYQVEKKYSFPGFLLESGPGGYPPISYSLIINGIYIYKNYYVVFLGKRTLKRKKVAEYRIECLIFNRDGGTLKTKFSVPGDFDPFFISPEGYVLARRYHEDEVKLYIYQLDI